MNSSYDPFSQYVVPGIQGTDHIPKKSQEDSDVFAKYVVGQPGQPAYEDEDLDPEIERHIARWTSRGIEQVLGAPGNIRDFAYFVKDVYQKSLPEKLKVKEPESFKNIESALPVAKAASSFLEWFPTSSQLKKKSSEMTKGYTEPKSKWENIGDEIVENIVSSSLPGTGQRNLFRNIGIPVFTQAAKEGIEVLGFEDKVKTATSLAVPLTLNLMNRGNGPQYVKRLWDTVERGSPNMQISSATYMQRANDLKARLSQGLNAPSEAQAVAVVNKFIEQGQKGYFTPQEIVSMNRSLNEIVGDPTTLTRARTQLNEVRGMIQDAAGDVGRQYPKWYKMWKDANQGWGAIANSNYIANTISNMYSKPFLSQGMKQLFGGAVTTLATTAGALAPPLFMIYKGTQILNRIAQSPQLSGYYRTILKDAMRQNIPGMVQSIEKLDKALSAEEKKSKGVYKSK